MPSLKQQRKVMLQKKDKIEEKEIKFIQELQETINHIKDALIINTKIEQISI